MTVFRSQFTGHHTISSDHSLKEEFLTWFWAHLQKNIHRRSQQTRTAWSQQSQNHRQSLVLQEQSRSFIGPNRTGQNLHRLSQNVHYRSRRRRSHQNTTDEPDQPHRIIQTYVTLQHKTRHKGPEIYASSESWINNLCIDVWFVMIGQYL